MDIFAQWSTGATTFDWPSSTPANAGRDVTVFTRRAGTPGAPALVCVHGFQTSSIDFFSLAGELGAEFDIFMLDFPGYGFSEKPPAPYVYSLYDDARLLVHAITQEWCLTDYTMITHDRGSSVGIIALGMLAAEHPKVVPTDVTSPMPTSTFRSAPSRRFKLLCSTTQPDVPRQRRPHRTCWRQGWGRVRSCRRTLADPEIAALAKCFAHHDGIGVLPDTKYLHERAADETSWLTTAFRPVTSTRHSYGACTTTSLRCASPTTCGRPFSTQARDEPLLDRPQCRSLPAI